MERPDILSAKNIFSLYIDRARSTSIWNAADRAIKYTRRFFFITKLLRFAAAVITFVQTSAMLIASATLILTLLPLVLIVVLAAGISGWFCENRILRKYPPPKDGSIYVLLPPDRELLEKHQKNSETTDKHPKKPDKHIYREALARDLSSSGTVYVVDSEPGYLFKGLVRGLYPAKDVNGVTYLSKPLFLRMRAKYFDKTPERMNYLI